MPNANNTSPPLEPVTDGPAKEPDGRTAKGTFAPGNKIGRGNPHAKQLAALRAALLGTLTPKKMAAIGERLYTAALAGNWTAAKLLLTYAIGKAPAAVDDDQLGELDE